MRSVLFIRHAKSSWDSAAMRDFDRPLNERGKKDAPEMAKRLLEKNIPLDSFISSPAKRASKTAGIFAEAYGLSPGDIVLKAALYLPSPDAFFEVIEETPNRFHHLAICSHNPAITDFVNLLTAEIRIDNMPTCGIFAIKTHISQWQDFRKSTKQFWFFDYPKTDR
ncbi:MAG TPA: histidine phosphatase family protein [Agriterribacter sp.]|nr:histidine phosphatase family protein [Agriterribacter sp.]HRQ49114.1 histidine phosphatase family protein [Agriterribacter sp.]